MPLSGLEAKIETINLIQMSIRRYAAALYVAD
jgi:hypothetical protein